MMDAPLKFKCRQRDAADFYDGGDTVREIDNTPYHCVDAFAQLLKFAISGDRYLCIQVAVCYGIQISKNIMDAVYYVLFDEIIQKENHNRLNKEQIEKSCRGIFPQFLKKNLAG